MRVWMVWIGLGMASSQEIRNFFLEKEFEDERDEILITVDELIKRIKELEEEINAMKTRMDTIISCIDLPI